MEREAIDTQIMDAYYGTCWWYNDPATPSQPETSFSSAEVQAVGDDQDLGCALGEQHRQEIVAQANGVIEAQDGHGSVSRWRGRGARIAPPLHCRHHPKW